MFNLNKLVRKNSDQKRFAYCIDTVKNRVKELVDKDSSLCVLGLAIASITYKNILETTRRKDNDLDIGNDFAEHFIVYHHIEKTLATYAGFYSKTLELDDKTDEAIHTLSDSSVKEHKQ